MITCPRCHSVALCKECHADGEGPAQFHCTETDAEAVTIECNACIISIACTGMVVEQGSVLTIESNTDSKKAFLPKDWVEYLEKKRKDFSMPHQMMSMAPVMTVLHALRNPALFGKEVAKLERLVVHFLGASVAELVGMPNSSS